MPRTRNTIPGKKRRAGSKERFNGEKAVDGNVRANDAEGVKSTVSVNTRRAESITQSAIKPEGLNGPAAYLLTVPAGSMDYSQQHLA